MMIRDLKTCLAGCLVLLAISPCAFAGFAIVGAGTYGLNSNGQASPNDLKAGFGYGGGAEISARLGMGTDLTLGGEYLLRGDSGSLATGGTTQWVHFPALLHFRMARGLALSLGGYYDLSLNTATVPSDYGLSGGLRFWFPGNGMGLFLEGLFDYGLKPGAGYGSISSSASGSNTEEVIFQLGLAFGGH